MTTDYVKLGLGAAISKLQTTVSVLIAGFGCDIFVDHTVVPNGIGRLIMAASLSPDSKLTGTENISMFVCDSTMAPLDNPISQQTGRVIYARLGALLAFDTVAGADSTNFPLGNNCVNAMLAPGQYLRFVTASQSAPFPNVGDFANIQVFYADIPLC